MKQPEARLTAKILKVLRKHGGFWIKIHGGPFQRAGLPDIIGCYRGMFVGLEVKMPGAPGASKMQRHILSRIVQAGGVSEVVRSTQAALNVPLAIDTAIDDS